MGCHTGRRPRLFLIFCCLFSITLGAMSSLFFYYPEGMNLPMFASDSVISRGHSGQDDKGHNVEQVEDSLSNSGGQSHNGNDKNRHHIFFSEINNDEEEESEGNVNSGGKIRHQAHHFDHERYDEGEIKSVDLSVQEFEEKSVFSSVVDTRLIHLDFKGAPPRVSFIKEVLKMSHAAGINGVLIEWEDTFPWTGSLENLTLAYGGYNLSEVLEIVAYAEKLSMEVIPLIQTFGHVEFITKSEEFRHLRELDEDPQSFCPSKPGSLEVINEMISQILQVHKNSRFVHIGCDEVNNLHMCPLCQSAFEFRDEVFLNHVIRVAKIIRSREKIPIVWDDMLRSISIKRLVDSGIGSLVEPMVWVYAEDIDRFVGWESWDKYSKIFPTIWAAAAFKGAFGETITIPPLSRHAENSQRWVDVITRESVRWKKGVGGLVLTGWSRYDHFAVLCELLPAAIPSLLYSSLVISTPNSNGGEVIRNRVFVPKNFTLSTQAPGEESLPSLSTSAYVVSSPEASSPDPSGRIVEATSAKSISDINKNIVTSESYASADSQAPLSRLQRSTRRKIPHPRSLMQKESGLSRFGMTGSVDVRPLHSNPLSEVADKNQLISQQFHRILHCSNHPESIAAMIKDAGDTELSFASRCNFPGVAFFRTLFRLRSLLTEVWELEAKILRGRGWATPYNVRHNYSLPSRIDEVIFNQVPRFRRNLSLTAKSVVISLKTIFNGEVILEWLEQNIWEAWLVLDNFEKVGEHLRRRNTWPRRPLESPPKMIEDLGLQAIDLFQHQEL